MRVAREQELAMRGRVSVFRRRLRRQALAGLAAALLLVTACGEAEHSSGPAEDDSWAVTAWGDRYEVFPEIDALVAGEKAAAHTHVTVLDGFQPLSQGTVEIVLSGPAGEEVFASDRPARPGIFNVELAPAAPGEFTLSFRIDSVAGREELAGGRVRVGTAAAPGGRVEEETAAGAETVSFLKEQQWRTDFATAWPERGALHPSVRGLVRLRPPAGGESWVSAPIGGVLAPSPWPYVGQSVSPGQALQRLVPNLETGSSMEALEAGRSALALERDNARARLARLEELRAVDAASLRELEEASLRSEQLALRLEAADRDLAAARAARGAGGGAEGMVLRAPFAGRVAAVAARPGAVVEVGAELVRVVRTDATWLEISLSPAQARTLERAASLLGATLENAAGVLEELGGDGLRLVAVGPEVDAASGTVPVLVEAAQPPPVALGAVLEAELLLAGEVPGLVVPTSAVIDDAGVAVIYVQVEGETFARREVRVLLRQGERMLIEGVREDERLVTVGSQAIRRAGLLSSGPVEGHVH